KVPKIAVAWQNMLGKPPGWTRPARPQGQVLVIRRKSRPTMRLQQIVIPSHAHVMDDIEGEFPQTVGRLVRLRHSGWSWGQRMSDESRSLFLGCDLARDDMDFVSTRK